MSLQLPPLLPRLPVSWPPDGLCRLRDGETRCRPRAPIWKTHQKKRGESTDKPTRFRPDYFYRFFLPDDLHKIQISVQRISYRNSPSPAPPAIAAIAFPVNASPTSPRRSSSALRTYYWSLPFPRSSCSERHHEDPSRGKARLGLLWDGSHG